MSRQVRLRGSGVVVPEVAVGSPRSHVIVPEAAVGSPRVRAVGTIIEPDVIEFLDPFSRVGVAVDVRGRARPRAPDSRLR